MKAPSTPEASFVCALKNHRSSDFSMLYDAYSPALYGFLLRLVNDPTRAEDLLQDTFIKIWSKSHQYDPEQGRMFTWFLAIARNVAMDELSSRKAQIKKVTYMQERSESAHTPSVVEGTVHTSLLSRLDPKYREVVELMYYQDYTSQETADRLKLPIGTVKTRVRTALQKLKAHFSQDIIHYIA